MLVNQRVNPQKMVIFMRKIEIHLELSSLGCGALLFGPGERVAIDLGSREDIRELREECNIHI
jgi:hypothetical protein